MKNWVLLITFLISLIALLFKTTRENENGKRVLNMSGYLILCLMLTSLAFNIYISYVEKKAAALSFKNQKEKDSLASDITSANWKNTAARSIEVINRLKSDSVNNARFQALQTGYIFKSEEYNSLITKNLAIANDNLDDIRYPIDSLENMCLGLGMEITFKNKGLDYFGERYEPALDENNRLILNMNNKPNEEDKHLAFTFKHLRHLHLVASLYTAGKSVEYEIPSFDFLEYYKAGDSAHNEHLDLKFDFQKFSFQNYNRLIPVSSGWDPTLKTYKNSFCQSSVTLYIVDPPDTNYIDLRILSVSFSSRNNKASIFFNKMTKGTQWENILWASKKCSDCEIK